MADFSEIKGLYYPVLDHGFVSLVDVMGDDSSIVQAARTSYGAGTKKVNEDRGLIRYLMRHHHSTPVEMCEYKFHVRLPIFVARQLIRHRTASVNEASLRYSLAPLQYYLPEFESFKRQSSTNRQGRGDQADREVYDKISVMWQGLFEQSGDLYKQAVLIEDIARELGRIHLPVSLYTEWYWKIDLHNLLHFLKLRCDSHAQEEIQKYAFAKAGFVKMLNPIAFEAWVDYNFCARSFSRLELVALEESFRTGKVGTKRLAEIGLTQREIEEFVHKTSYPPTVPNFDLEMSKFKTAEYFREKIELSVPKVQL